MHIKFNYRETYAYNKIGVPSETALRRSKRRCSGGVRGGGDKRLSQAVTGLWTLLLSWEGASWSRTMSLESISFITEKELVFPSLSLVERATCHGPQQEKCMVWQHLDFCNWTEGLALLQDWITSNQRWPGSEPWWIHSNRTSGQCWQEQDDWQLDRKW